MLGNRVRFSLAPKAENMCAKGSFKRDNVRGLGEEEPMSVHLDVEQDAGCVVTVSGDADLYAAASVERELVRLVDAGKRSIVVDLTDATFIDSTMLRVL